MKFKLVESLLEDLDSNRRALIKKFNNNVILVFKILEMDPTVNMNWKNTNWNKADVYNYIVFNFKKDMSFDELFSKDIVEFKGEGKFLPWLGKIYQKNENKFNNDKKLKTALDYFYQHSNQFENKDIFQFKTEEDLINKVNELSVNEKSNFEIKIDNLEKNMDVDNLPYPDFNVQKAKEGINLVYHDKDWLVYVPENYEASVVLRGQNAEWCTGWHEKNKRMDDKYNEYTQDGAKLYIIINKQNPDEKYQVTIHPDGSWTEFHDAGNIPLKNRKLDSFFDENEGLSNFFGKLTKYNLCAPKEIKEKEYIYDVSHPIPTWVEKIIIKDGITELPDYIFYNNNHIKEIKIPDSVTKIGDSAFYNCTALSKLIFEGDNLTVIDDCAFSGCTSLQEIKIPDSVTKIGDSAFVDCISLSKIIFKGNNLTKIDNNTFCHCTSLPEIIIPESVTEIGYETIAYCYSLIKVTLLGDITKIREYAFYGCKSLQEITIPDSITEIASNAFQRCPNLVIKSNSEYVYNYCKENNINCEKLN